MLQTINIIKECLLFESINESVVCKEDIKKVEQEINHSNGTFAMNNQTNLTSISILLISILLFSLLGGFAGSLIFEEKGPAGDAGETGADGQIGANGSLGFPGVPGEKGDVGNSPLVIVENENAGDNCAAGGQAITTGVDNNANSLLEFEEVSATTYLCGHGIQQGFLIDKLDGSIDYQMGSYDTFGNLIQVELGDGDNTRIIDYIFDTNNQLVSSTEDVNHDGTTDSKTVYYHDENSVMTHSLTTIVTTGAEPEYLNGSLIYINYNLDGTISEYFYDSNANDIKDSTDYYLAPDSDSQYGPFSGEIYINTSTILSTMTKTILENGSVETFDNYTTFDSEGNVSSSRYTQAIATYDSSGELYSSERFIWEDGEEYGHHLTIYENETFLRFRGGENHSDELVKSMEVNSSVEINSILSNHGLMFSEFSDLEFMPSESDSDLNSRRLVSSQLWMNGESVDYGLIYSIDSYNQDLMPLWYNTTVVGDAPWYYNNESIEFIYQEDGVLVTIKDECSASNPRISTEIYNLINGVYKSVSEGTDSDCNGDINSYTNQTYDAELNLINYVIINSGVVTFFNSYEYNAAGDLVAKNNSVISSNGGGYDRSEMTYDSQGRISTINVYQNLSMSTSESLILTESITLFGDNIWGSNNKVQFELEQVSRYYIDASLMNFLDWKISSSESFS